MKILTLEVPTMYGDHHVLEVRRLLLEMTGVIDVYASSAFQIVDVTYDETQLGPDAIEACLGEAGYLGEMQLPVEFGVDIASTNGKPFFRRPVSIEATTNASFQQVIPRSGRALWPCPGLSAMRLPDEEEING